MRSNKGGKLKIYSKEKTKAELETAVLRLDGIGIAE
jgi:hypothetical protein